MSKYDKANSCILFVLFENSLKFINCTSTWSCRFNIDIDIANPHMFHEINIGKPEMIFLA